MTGAKRLLFLEPDEFNALADLVEDDYRTAGRWLPELERVRQKLGDLR